MVGDRPEAMQDASQAGAGQAPPLLVPSALLRAIPHLPAFFPERPLHPAGAAPMPGAEPLVLDGAGPAGGPALLATADPFRAPRFGRHQAPVALLAVPGLEGRDDPLALALATPVPDPSAGRRLIALLREHRVGGAPGLPEPSPEDLGLPRGEAVLVLAGAGAPAMLEAAKAEAAGRPVVLAADPDAPALSLPDPPAGVRRIAGRIAPWALLDLAAALHAGPGAERMALLAHGAGVPVRWHGGPAPAWLAAPASACFAALAAAVRCADPFRARPWHLEDAVRQLSDWRLAAAEHRRIVALTGIEWFKLRPLREALSHPDGAPAYAQTGTAAIRAARRAGGAVGVWAAAMPPGLPARCAAAGVPLVRIEDGFVRSAGLGVMLAPAASLVLDARGIHYDAAAESGIEHLLATTEFGTALLDRAAALRRALTKGGVTKYNLRGTLPPLGLPPGREAILVVGQVEDDAAMLRGGAGRIRTNRDLLRAVRAENPGAVLLYKPHPDVETGMRRGAVPPAEAARLADRVLAGVPIGPLYAQVGAVHCIASLAGFEALLRGVRVVTWGRPFYAGWGLTEDRDPPPRRGRTLPLDALVAAALILYPRYRDPVTGLPCPPEVVVERLAAAMPPAPRRSPVPLALRALTARGSRFLAEWWAAR